jgi:hypothetical protein
MLQRCMGYTKHAWACIVKANIGRVAGPGTALHTAQAGTSALAADRLPNYKQLLTTCTAEGAVTAKVASQICIGGQAPDRPMQLTIAVAVANRSFGSFSRSFSGSIMSFVCLQQQPREIHCIAAATAAAPAAALTRCGLPLGPLVSVQPLNRPVVAALYLGEVAHGGSGRWL